MAISTKQRIKMLLLGFILGSIILAPSWYYILRG